MFNCNKQIRRFENAFLDYTFNCLIILFSRS